MSASGSWPAYFRVLPEGVCLSVKVQPRASRNEIAGELGGELKIKVTAPPVDSAANEELVRFLAGQLGCAKGAVELLRGQTSRHKVILLRGITPAQALKGLNLAS